MTDLAVAENLPQTRGPAYAGVQLSPTSGGGAMLLPQTFGDAVAFAQIMARSQHAIPRHLRDNAGACLAVTMQALRWEMDPFAVAAKAYSVNDMIAYEAQLIAAVVHTRAPIARRPDYEFFGDGPSRQCRISATMKDSSVKEYVSPRFDKITTKNSPLWKTDPDQQLGYYSIRSWARRHVPEVMLGVYAPDEADDFRIVTPQLPPVETLKAEQSAPVARIEIVDIPPTNGLPADPGAQPSEAARDGEEGADASSLESRVDELLQELGAQPTALKIKAWLDRNKPELDNLDSEGERIRQVAKSLIAELGAQR